MDHIFIIGGILFFLFFLVNYLFQKLKLPFLLAYIFLGIGFAGLFTETELATLEQISRMGIVLLFFLHGLQFPLNRLVNISRRIWKVGIMDIVLSFGFSVLLAYLLGFELISALIIGGVAYASSSSITIRMIEDNKRGHFPEGEFKLGLLIFEDLFAPIMISFLVGLIQIGTVTANSMLFIFSKVVILTIASLLLAYYGFRKADLFLHRYLKKKFIPLLAVSIALFFAGIAEYMGVSKLLGAFLAGVMLSETGTSRELDRMIEPVKNLFMPFFFFWFGTSIILGTGVGKPFSLILLIIWGFLAKMIVGFWGGRIYGLTKKGSIRSALSLGQRGEFSVVIAALAETFLSVFLGIYIAATAIIGVYFFRMAPIWTEKITLLIKEKKYFWGK